MEEKEGTSLFDHRALFGWCKWIPKRLTRRKKGTILYIYIYILVNAGSPVGRVRRVGASRRVCTARGSVLSTAVIVRKLRSHMRGKGGGKDFGGGGGGGYGKGYDSSQACGCQP